MTQIPATLLQVLTDVANERDAQNTWWGQQDHNDEWWLAILLEEVGELATAMLAHHFKGTRQRHVGTAREEAIQVAAVAVALVECIDRNTEARGAGGASR